jgi:hypothetical protein
MEVKNGKQYLPQTYEAFVAIKKKNVKTAANLIIKALQSTNENNIFANFNQ